MISDGGGLQDVLSSEIITDKQRRFFDLWQLTGDWLEKNVAGCDEIKEMSWFGEEKTACKYTVEDIFLKEAGLIKFNKAPL